MIIGICDDMPAVVQELAEMVEAFFRDKPVSPTVKTFCSGSELLAYPEEIDILFLDIELGDHNALDLVKAYRSKYRNTLLIMVTSYEQYLDDAMDLNIFRYIDKPVRVARINSALERAIERFDNSRLCVRDNENKTHHIDKKDIVYIESYLRHVLVNTSSQTITTNSSLKEWRAKVSDTSYFASPHNSYIVNLNYIKLFSRTKITLSVGDKTVDIPVSSRHQPDFKRSYLNYMKEGYTNVKNSY